MSVKTRIPHKNHRTHMRCIAGTHNVERKSKISATKCTLNKRQKSRMLNNNHKNHITNDEIKAESKNMLMLQISGHRCLHWPLDKVLQKGEVSVHAFNYNM